MLQALVLTAAIICTVLSVLQWLVFLVELADARTKNVTIKFNFTIPSIFLWVIYCHL